MKGRKYTKTLAKIWVKGITRLGDIRGNVLPKFIELCMETPCWSSSGWAPTWWTETNRNICYRVLLQKREFTPRGTHRHYSNTFSNTVLELFRYTGKNNGFPIFGYFRVFKEYPQKSQIWKSETSPNQGTCLGIPWLGLVSLCQIWDFYGYFLNTLKYPKMGICYFFLW